MTAPQPCLYALSKLNDDLGGDLMSAHDFRCMPISRRRLLGQSALAAGALALPLASPRVARAAGELKPVNMTLDWVYEGPNLDSSSRTIRAFIGMRDWTSQSPPARAQVTPPNWSPTRRRKSVLPTVTPPAMASPRAWTLRPSAASIAATRPPSWYLPIPPSGRQRTSKAKRWR